jgi:tellurite resistance protein TerC
LWSWAGAVGIILAALAVDLFVFHRDAHRVSLREAAVASVGWVSLGLAFGVLIWVSSGPQDAGQYFTGYLIEKALSVDNLFVIALLMGAFVVPTRLQHRVLFYGVIGALLLRAGFIAAGTSLLHSLDWAIYGFGALLVVLSIRMLRTGHEPRAVSENRTLRLLRRVVPVAEDYHGTRLVVRHPGNPGRLMVTPLLAVLLAIETTDLVFAVDSIPAVLAITDKPFLVFTSNAFAILGLRALYFVLAAGTARLVYVKTGLAAILLLVGMKMLLADTVDVPVGLSLIAIVAILAASIGASLHQSQRQRGPTGGAEEADHDRSAVDVGLVGDPDRPGRSILAAQHDQAEGHDAGREEH